jgi:hypothetical protein
LSKCLYAIENLSNASRSLSTIAELVQTRLPRELRDHVHSFLWDDDTTKHFGSDHQWYLLRAGEICQQTPDEAVLWLYDNYQGFEVKGTKNLRLFLETDVFHVGLSPASAQSVRPRRLSLRVEIYKPRDIAASFTELTNRQLRHDFALDINLQYKPQEVRLIARALEALEPVVRNLDDTHKVAVGVYILQDGCVRMEVKHMPGPGDYKKWCDWIAKDLASNPSTSAVGGITRQSTLSVRMAKWDSFSHGKSQDRV